jgi:outer membrane receptor protein involved in Fe transport
VIAALLLWLGASTISGFVHDSLDGVVAGASVIVRPVAGGPERQTTTGPDGRFTIDAPDGDVTIVVRAGGFAETTERIGSGDRKQDLSITVVPAAILETVTVTPTRNAQVVADIPASVNVVTSEEFKASPAIIADDTLRQVASFSLFRRTSAIAAQPTTQGVSLRGIGPSGQSRTLVLLDGIPFNDPFGGWVYWTRVPMENVDRVEIQEDTSSSLYGNMGMGGVINIITGHPTRRTIELKPQYGNNSTPKFDFLASDQWSKVAAAVEGSFLHTDGFPIVAPIERGPIDNNANVEYSNVTGKLEFTPSDRVQGFFRAGYFSESRNNAKVGELNDTRWTTANGGITARLSDDSDLQARVFVDVQRAHFNFLAVTNAATTRNLVRLSTDQHVPTDGVGAMAQWSKVLGSKNVFNAGFDWRYIDGDSNEDNYVPAVPTSISGVTQAATLSTVRVSGGTQQLYGFFAQDIFTPMDKLSLTLSARVDSWHNYDGHINETVVATGAAGPNNRGPIDARDDSVVSPHVAAMYHLTDKVSVWGAVNSGFRAPTLTELYRQFTVGTVTTKPNDQLGPERLWGGELGVNILPMSNVAVRATWFDNTVSNPVLNITLTPTTAQKQNIPQSRVRGIQTDVDVRVAQWWRLSAGYIYDNATVTDGGANAATLNGKWLQQVARNRGTFQIAYANPKYINAALAVQIVGLQYNDDLNVNFIPPATLVSEGYEAAYPAGLPGYTVSDLSLSRAFGRNFEAFLGIQNIFDKAYFVQTNPSTIGTPRLVNGGVRVRFGR